MARYDKSHKGETRQRIIEIASRRFRAEGVDGVGIASIMADAGLTNGGFYVHFTSKEDLIAEAVVHALMETPAGPARKLGQGAYDLPAFIADYLSVGHRDHPERGCAVAALSPDLARRPAGARAAFQEEGAAIISRIAAALSPSIPERDRRLRAFAVFSHLVGTLQMARLAIDGALSSEILDGGRRTALFLAGFVEAHLTEPPAKDRSTLSGVGSRRPRKSSA